MSPSDPRFDELRTSLGLVPHPEGGFYREHHRSSQTSAGRSVGTAIFYLLPAGTHSAWHRVRQDELWHHYEGAPLELHLIDEQGYRVERLGPVDGAAQPCRVVPALTWQAARPVGGFTLCGCTVSPAFSFDDWSLADAATRADLAARHPEAADVLESLA